MAKKESVAWPRGEMRFQCLNGDDRKTERFEKDGANIIPYLLDSFETEELIPILDKRECVGITPTMKITSRKKR